MVRENWQRLRSGGTTTVVFVHGLTGHFRDTWGRFPDILIEDPLLGHCEVVCWGYPSRLGSRWARLPYIGRRLPDLVQVANALATDLKNPEIVSPRNDLALVGHSMGGLVLLQFLLSCAERAAEHDRLRRVRQLLLYASPTQGAQVPRLVRSQNIQLRDLDGQSEFVQGLLDRWDRVFGEQGSARNLAPPVTAVVGLEDGTVEEASARAFWSDVETAPGDHRQVVKPADRDHSSFQVLQSRLRATTLPSLVRGRGEVKKANIRLVEEAREDLYTVGSRSRDPDYLGAIESVLRTRNDLRYTRVLLGAPRRSELRQHLLRVRELRDPADRSHGFRTLDLALYDDPRRQFEFNLCGNERRCLMVLPSADGGIGEYDTAVVFSDPELVRGYRRLTQALVDAGTRLDDPDRIKALPVLG